jgi:hypothetical protein
LVGPARLADSARSQMKLTCGFSTRFARVNCPLASFGAEPQLLEWDLGFRPSEPFYVRTYLILCASSIATLLDDGLDLPTRQSEETTE